MADLLEKIKERISEKDCPIKTVKGVAEAIGMSEGGFYRMVQRGTIKYATMLALAKELKVNEAYLTGKTDINDSNPILDNERSASFGDDVLQRILHDIQEMKQVFEEQLRVKDRQLESKDTQIGLLLGLLGKPKGATGEPLSIEADLFEGMMREYKALVLGQVVAPSLKLKQTGGKVGGAPFSYAENTVNIS